MKIYLLMIPVPIEIQELRHKSSPSSAPNDKPLGASSSESSSIIDQALINLDERLESVSRSIEAVEETLLPFLRSAKTPTQNQTENVGESDKIILHKHAALLSDWEIVQNEAEVLREELKEDKWLTVFRSVSEQADGMMKSLEKAVTQCQVCFSSSPCESKLITFFRISSFKSTDVGRPIQLSRSPTPLILILILLISTYS